MSALLFHGLWQREERKERVAVVVMVLEGVGVCGGESIWFGASGGSVLACSIPGAQQIGVPFQPPQTHHPAKSCTPFSTQQILIINVSLLRGSISRPESG